jgi:hypothetical protein
MLSQLKIRRALALNNCGNMPVTANAIVDATAQEANVLAALTSKQLAAVMRLVETNYHKGRASTGAEVIDGDAVWVSSIGKMIPLAALRSITITKDHEIIRTPYDGRYSYQVKDANDGGRYADPARAYYLAQDGGDISHLYTEQRWDTTTYRMPDYQERV